LQTNLDTLRQSTPGRTPTLEDVVRLRARSGRVVGTPEQIADTLKRWRAAGVDGVNVINATLPGSYVEFIDHVMPVLRQRGLAAARPASSSPGRETLRHRLFGADRLNARHPATRYRGAFGSAGSDSAAATSTNS
jgi:hypothetical protein